MAGGHPFLFFPVSTLSQLVKFQGNMADAQDGSIHLALQKTYRAAPEALDRLLRHLAEINDLSWVVSMDALARVAVAAPVSQLPIEFRTDSHGTSPALLHAAVTPFGWSRPLATQLAATLATRWTSASWLRTRRGVTTLASFDLPRPLSPAAADGIQQLLTPDVKRMALTRLDSAALYGRALRLLRATLGPEAINARALRWLYDGLSLGRVAVQQGSDGSDQNVTFWVNVRQHEIKEAVTHGPGAYPIAWNTGEHVVAFSLSPETHEHAIRDPNPSMVVPLRALLVGARDDVSLKVFAS